jgi:hypothetical protein
MELPLFRPDSLNGLIQPFQQPERVIGFFNAYRDDERVTRNRLRDVAQQFQNWVKNRAERWGWAASSNGTRSCAKQPAALRQLPQECGAAATRLSRPLLEPRNGSDPTG